MEITLEQGPLDGKEFRIPMDVWARGLVRLPIISDDWWGSSKGYDAAAFYERRKFAPSWAGFCAMPIHRWMFIPPRKQ